MKYQLYVIIGAIILLLLSSTRQVEIKTSPEAGISEIVLDEIYTVDPIASKIIWKARRVAYGHEGTLQIKHGKFAVSNKTITTGEFIIDMNTIKNLDLVDVKMNNKLVGHLKSRAFFYIKKHPESSLKITSIKKQQSDLGNYSVIGNLTIKDITNEVSFPATIEINNNRLTALAKITFDRSKFNIRYGSGNFFENLGDKLIYDDINLEISLVAWNK